MLKPDGVGRRMLREICRQGFPDVFAGRAKVHCGQDVATRPERFHLLGVVGVVLCILPGRS